MRVFNGCVVALSALLIFAGGVSAPAQDVPAGSESMRLPITVGGFGSVFQPDYAGGKLGQAGPKPLIGVVAFLDVRYARWVQLEAEGRWSAFNAYRGFTEDNYLFGPRIPIYSFGRATTYAKVLFGRGDGDFRSGPAFVIAYGGGLDYRLSKRFKLRAFDFEFQQWRTSPTLFPYGGSAGLGFNF
jgi:hypothetical protein